MDESGAGTRDGRRASSPAHAAARSAGADAWSERRAGLLWLAVALTVGAVAPCAAGTTDPAAPRPSPGPDDAAPRGPGADAAPRARVHDEGAVRGGEPAAPHPGAGGGPGGPDPAGAAPGDSSGADAARAAAWSAALAAQVDAVRAGTVPLGAAADALAASLGDAAGVAWALERLLRAAEDDDLLAVRLLAAAAGRVPDPAVPLLLLGAVRRTGPPASNYLLHSVGQDRSVPPRPLPPVVCVADGYPLLPVVEGPAVAALLDLARERERDRPPPLLNVLAVTATADARADAWFRDRLGGAAALDDVADVAIPYLQHARTAAGDDVAARVLRERPRRHGQSLRAAAFAHAGRTGGAASLAAADDLLARLGDLPAAERAAVLRDAHAMFLPHGPATDGARVRGWAAAAAEATRADDPELRGAGAEALGNLLVVDAPAVEAAADVVALLRDRDVAQRGGGVLAYHLGRAYAEGTSRALERVASDAAVPAPLREDAWRGVVRALAQGQAPRGRADAIALARATAASETDAGVRRWLRTLAEAEVEQPPEGGERSR